MTSEHANKVTLTVGDAIHEGWTDASISLNMDHLAGAFRLSLTEEYLHNGTLLQRPVKAGAACRLAIDGVVVLTGWVDSHNPSYDAGSRSVSVSGRAKAGDLVDCSAEVKEYLKQKIDTIAADLCAPFGIDVHIIGDMGAAFERVAVNTGDTVHATLDRLCRQRGLLAWSDGLGNLVLGRGTAGQAVAELVRGRNVLSASATDDFTGRFSKIVMRGTKETPDNSDAAAASQEEGIATDDAIGRPRPKIMVAETQGGTATLTQRAEHEMRVSQGKSRTAEATVQGWHHGNGLWLPRQTVTFNDDWLGIDGDFVISNVELSKSDSGTTAKLTLNPPTTFDILAEAGDGQ